MLFQSLHDLSNRAWGGVLVVTVRVAEFLVGFPWCPLKFLYPSRLGFWVPRGHSLPYPPSLIHSLCVEETQAQPQVL